MTESLFRHILVPTDGSQHSVAAGRLAVKLTTTQKARLSFIYIVDETVAEELASASGRTSDQVQAELKLSGQRYLDYLCRAALEAGLKSEQVIRYGAPSEEIAAYARDQKVDLIIIGHVGRRSSPHVLLGRVTERVIEFAPCPVLVVK